MTPEERAEVFFRDFPFPHGAWYREETLKPLFVKTIEAAVADAVQAAGQLHCDLCHCCGERRHDDDDPCVSCARVMADAVAKERESLLAGLYDANPVTVAKFCDEIKDRSGALLGRVREQAAAIRGKR